MNYKSIAGSFAYYWTRMVAIARQEGLIALAKRIGNLVRPDIHQIHLLVLSYHTPSELLPFSDKDDYNNNRCSAPLRRMPSDLEIKQITEDNDVDLDFLTEIDEWKIPKSVTLKDLHEGCHGYIVKKNNEMIATAWATQRESFVDSYLRREFSLAPDETYFWRCHCIPAYRGQGIMPCLFGSHGKGSRKFLWQVELFDAGEENKCFDDTVYGEKWLE